MRLAEIWKYWDEHPGNEAAANDMEEECAVIAIEMGMKSNVFRARLGERRRNGESIEEICAEIDRRLNKKPTADYVPQRVDNKEAARAHLAQARASLAKNS